MSTSKVQMTASVPKTKAPLSIDEFAALILDSNHDHLTDQIVASMGGIDQILTEYIRITREYEDEELLSGSEMQKIADIISAVPAAPADTIYDKLYARARLKDNTFHLNTSETMWHSICADRQIADRIITVLFSKFTIAIVGIAAVIWVVYGIFTEHRTNALYEITLLTAQTILILYLVPMILSCNIPALLLILTTFDFWMKMGYSIVVSILSFMIWDKWDDSAIWTLSFVIDSAITVLCITNLAVIEGHHGNWKISFMFGLIMSLVISTVAVLFTFGVYGHGGRQLELWFGLSLNLVELMGSCLQVLSLFLWKQTLMAAYTRGEWCICIYLSPYIQWNNE